uniref:Uncharacterized protein n=3 Tax=unclassified bacterial viruses TaxID=12333 RepID=A0AAU6W057_9VIRU
MAKKKPKIDVTKKHADEYEQERARVEEEKRKVQEQEATDNE